MSTTSTRTIPLAMLVADGDTLAAVEAAGCILRGGPGNALDVLVAVGWLRQCPPLVREVAVEAALDDATEATAILCGDDEPSTEAAALFVRLVDAIASTEAAAAVWCDPAATSEVEAAAYVGRAEGAAELVDVAPPSEARSRLRRERDPVPMAPSPMRDALAALFGVR